MYSNFQLRASVTLENKNVMIGWIIACFVLVIIFAVLGFTGIAKAFAAIGKVLFYIFLIILAIVVVTSLM